MSATEFDPTPAAVAEALERVSLRLLKEDARLERLLGTAFEDQGRAITGLRFCLRKLGYDRTLQVLDDKSLLYPRQRYFGFLRGSLFARGDRARAKEALQELPEAIRERELLTRERADLLKVRGVVLGESREPEEQSRDLGRGRQRRR